MSVVEGSLAVAATIGFQMSQDNDPFSDTVVGPGIVDFTAAPDATVYTEILLVQYTIAAAGSQTVNLNSFTTLINETATCTKVLGFLIKATGEDGQLQIAPGASNGIDFWLGGTSPTLTLDCGPDGCGLMLMDGISRTLSGSVKNIDLSNPGSETITVTIAALCGA